MSLKINVGSTKSSLHPLETNFPWQPHWEGSVLSLEDEVVA